MQNDYFLMRPTDDRIMKERDEVSVKLLKGERIYFGGFADICVKTGSVKILGATLRSGDGYITFYSPNSSSLLYVSPEFGVEVAEISLKESKNGPNNIFQGDPHFKGMFSFPDSNDLGVENLTLIKAKELDYVPFDVPADWMSVVDGLVDTLSSVPIVFVVGPRKVGKSTMSRYLCNSIWSHTRKVAFLDLDIGQTEFTPPGSMSLKIIDKGPLLGPPVSHQTVTNEIIYFGSMSPSDDPQRFLNGASQLFHKYLTQYHSTGIPLIVNTMGWITGLGLSLLQSQLHMIPVTHMVAFAQNEPNNYEYVQVALFEETKFAPAFSESDAPQVAYVHAAEASGNSSLRMNRVSPVDLRSLTFSSYFLGQYDSDMDKIIYPIQKDFRTAVPFAIPISKIFLSYPDRTNVPSKLQLMSLNLSVVGLSHRDRDSKSIKCFGLGLIRSIDRKKSLFYILTPLPLDYLKKCDVNCFIVGKVYLPSSFLSATSILNGPYLSFTSAFASAGSSTRKTRSNLSRKYNP